jgi:hypothetical protein
VTKTLLITAIWGLSDESLVHAVWRLTGAGMQNLASRACNIFNMHQNVCSTVRRHSCIIVITASDHMMQCIITVLSTLLFYGHDFDSTHLHPHYTQAEAFSPA